MAKQLTEPQAWREIARRWVEREECGAIGSCPIISNLIISLQIDGTTSLSMRGRIKKHLGGREFAYGDIREVEAAVDPYIERYREARALAALWLALEAEEDAK